MLEVHLDATDLHAESWASLLRNLKRRGMGAPALAIGDGALGFWAAVRDVWPETRAQRCWVHRLAQSTTFDNSSVPTC